MCNYLGGGRGLPTTPRFTNAISLAMSAIYDILSVVCWHLLVCLCPPFRELLLLSLVLVLVLASP